MRLKINKYDFTSNKVNKDIKIIQLSDIHFFDILNIKKNYTLINKINILHPDYIVITGDIIDRYLSIKDISFRYELILWLKELSKIYPLIVCLGNHDYSSSKYIENYNTNNFINNTWIKYLKDIKNLYIINNDVIKFKDINFYIFNPSHQYYSINHEKPELFIKEYKKLHFTLDKDKYNVLLTHSPISLSNNNVQENINNFDLILCGHMHSGCTPDILKHILPKNFGIISPQKQLFINNCRGKIKGSCNIIVSGCITKLSSTSHLRLLNNLFFKKEIELIKIKSLNNKNI